MNELQWLIAIITAQEFYSLLITVLDCEFFIIYLQMSVILTGAISMDFVTIQVKHVQTGPQL